VALADLIYSGVPAAMVGREQSIEIGPMSGLSNVHHWLAKRGIAPKVGLAEHLLQAAKTSNKTLEEVEVRALIAAF
jgi:2-isopropylmalate synthase